MPRPGETVTDGVFERIPGGKGANQAVAAARMGASVRFVGRFGHHYDSSYVRKRIEESRKGEAERFEEEIPF